MEYNHNVYVQDVWPHGPHFSLESVVRQYHTMCLFFVITETTLMLDRPIRVDQSTDLINMFEQTIE